MTRTVPADPNVMTVFTTLCINFVGDRLRNGLDPRSQL
jgi:ABC-type dipeptide/oligopeptide/nickel transport system permease subunit